MTQPRQPGDAPPRVISGSDQAANEAVPSAQQTPSGGQQPPPTAARPPDAPVQPGDKSLAEQQVKPDDGEDLSAQAAELEERLAAIRSKASGQETVRVKVEGVHSGLIHNGLYVGTDWTEVPVHALPAMMEGAANAGVTLTQEETES